MGYTFGFANPEYGSYDDLPCEEDVRLAVQEECEKAVADLGSDAYEPEFPAFVHDVESWLGAMDGDVAADEIGKAHDRAIKRAALRETSRIMADFHGVLAGTSEDATSELPGGCAIHLRMTSEEDR